MFLNPADAIWRLGSVVSQIQALAFVGPPISGHRQPPQEDPFVDRSHSLYRIARGLVRLRRSCRVLARGSLRVHIIEDAPGGLFVFSRFDNLTEAVIAVNPTRHERRLNRISLDSQVHLPENGLHKYRSVILEEESSAREYHVQYSEVSGPQLAIDNDLPAMSFAIFMPVKRLL